MHLPERPFRYFVRTLMRKSSHQNPISHSETSISCEASDNFHRKSFQNDRFVRGFRQLSQNKLPKRAFRTMLPTIFTEKASKTSVSHNASDNFHRRSFQNDRFVRCLRQFSQNKLPKRAFRTRLPTIFIEKTSKMIVSCEASKFHRRSFQNELFVRGFLQFHRTRLPKRAFHTMLPTIPTENLHFATASCNRPTESYERVHPAKAKCVHRYSGVPSKISKSTFHYSGVRKNV